MILSGGERRGSEVVVVVDHVSGNIRDIEEVPFLFFLL